MDGRYCTPLHCPLFFRSFSDPDLVLGFPCERSPFAFVSNFWSGTMAPTQLHLFPSSSSSMPRKSSFRRNKAEDMPNAAGEVNLKGVAFQVVSSPRTMQVNPASEAIRDSLFGQPNVAGAPDVEASSTADSDSSPKSSLDRKLRTRRRSSPLVGVASNSSDRPRDGDEDQLAPLPSNTHFGTISSPKRSRASHLKRSSIPSDIAVSHHVNVPSTPIDEIDELSPLPDRTCFQSATPQSQTERSGPLRAGSPASFKTARSPGYSSPMRSMFPQYDPSKPMDRQSYYPTSCASPPPAYLSDNVSKLGSPLDSPRLKRYDSAVGLVAGYEHIPLAAHADMEALWRASQEEFPIAGRKVKFGLYQSSSNGKALAVGTSHEDLIYTLEREHSASSIAKTYTIQKHCPFAPSTSPVAQFAPPACSPTKQPGKEAKESTAIFPQAAAVDAIESIVHSREAQHIAAFDPTAQSPEAVRLAQSAVAAAHRNYSCALTKKRRERDSLGAVTAAYDLCHPTLGTCAVTVTKSFSATAAAPTGPRAKISLHHPSATPAAVEADTLNLAFLDFAHDACVLDVPGLVALDSPYVCDTVLSALLAVAVIENDALVGETVAFEPPPRAPVKGGAERRAASAGGSSRAKGLFGGKKAKRKKGEVPPRLAVEEQVELPGLAKGALKVVEFGFKASAWVIVTGLKVGVEVVGFGVRRIAKA